MQSKAIPEVLSWYRSMKQTVCCTSCGENHPATLELHHIDPKTKVAAVSSMVYNGHSMTEVLQEYDKCTVLCGNCHSKEHYGHLYATPAARLSPYSAKHELNYAQV